MPGRPWALPWFWTVQRVQPPSWAWPLWVQRPWVRRPTFWARVWLRPLRPAWSQASQWSCRPVSWHWRLWSLAPWRQAARAFWTREPPKTRTALCRPRWRASFWRWWWPGLSQRISSQCLTLPDGGAARWSGKASRPLRLARPKSVDLWLYPVCGPRKRRPRPAGGQQACSGGRRPTWAAIVTMRTQRTLTWLPRGNPAVGEARQTAPVLRVLLWRCDRPVRPATGPAPGPGCPWAGRCR
jgi:hypothetical protein